MALTQFHVAHQFRLAHCKRLRLRCVLHAATQIHSISKSLPSAIWHIYLSQMATLKPSITPAKSLAAKAPVQRIPRGPGSRVLGLNTNDSLQIVQLVRSGFTVVQLKKFQKTTDFSWDKVSTITDIPRRTLDRRQSQAKLPSHESDRLWRAARIFDLALDLFEGNIQEANRWLWTPQRALGKAIPAELASTDIGARQVENLIIQLEHGVFP